jgi:hypothetical protein
MRHLYRSSVGRSESCRRQRPDCGAGEGEAAFPGRQNEFWGPQYGGVDGTFPNIIFPSAQISQPHIASYDLHLPLHHSSHNSCAYILVYVAYAYAFVHIRLYLRLHALTYIYHLGLRLPPRPTPTT